MWHASGRGHKRYDSLVIVRSALRGVGDASLGEWLEDSDTGSGVVHLRRRLSREEQEAFNIGEPIDIRGTDRERELVQKVLEEAPHLRGILG